VLVIDKTTLSSTSLLRPLSRRAAHRWHNLAMLLLRVHRQLTCLLFATVAAADSTIAPSNTSTTISGFQGTLKLVSADRQAQIAEVVPLTQQATKNSVCPP